MQPAREDVVQNFTVPASAATATDFFAAMMSVAWWGLEPRGDQKSSMYVVGPITGKMSLGTLAAAAVPGPASRTTVKRTTRRLRAVRRRGAIGTGSRSRRGTLAR